MLVGIVLGLVMLMLLWVAVGIFKLFIELIPLWLIIFLTALVLYILH